MNISRTRMHFLWVSVTFYDMVNIIHDVITTPNPFPIYISNVGVRHNKIQQIRC